MPWEERPVQTDKGRCVMFGCKELATRRNYCNPHYLDVRYGEKVPGIVVIPAHWQNGKWTKESRHVRMVRRGGEALAPVERPKPPVDRKCARECGRLAKKQRTLCVTCESREYRERNAEKVKARNHARYLANRDKVISEVSRYQRDNKETVNARHRARDKRLREEARVA